MVVKQLIEKFEPQDTVSMIDMNQLKQYIGLQTPESNPQSLFEQMAALENQLKKRMDNNEKVTIAIEKLPVEYQPVLTVEMRKEGALVTAQHIKNATIQHWWSIHGSYANNSVINGVSQDTKETGKELALVVFNGTCNRCGCEGHKEAECYAKRH